MNEALAYAETLFVVLLQDSVMVTAGWLADLLWPAIDDPVVGVVAPRSSTEEAEGRELQLFDDFSKLSAYVSHTRLRRQGEWRSVDVLSGACLLFTRELLLRVGGFDASLRQRRLWWPIGACGPGSWGEGSRSVMLCMFTRFIRLKTEVIL